MSHIRVRVLQPRVEHESAIAHKIGRKILGKYMRRTRAPLARARRHEALGVPTVKLEQPHPRRVQPLESLHLDGMRAIDPHAKPAPPKGLDVLAQLHERARRIRRVVRDLGEALPIEHELVRVRLAASSCQPLSSSRKSS